MSKCAAIILFATFLAVSSAPGYENWREKRSPENDYTTPKLRTEVSNRKRRQSWESVSFTNWNNGVQTQGNKNYYETDQSSSSNADTLAGGNAVNGGEAQPYGASFTPYDRKPPPPLSDGRHNEFRSTFDQRPPPPPPRYDSYQSQYNRGPPPHYDDRGYDYDRRLPPPPPDNFGGKPPYDRGHSPPPDHGGPPPPHYNRSPPYDRKPPLPPPYRGQPPHDKPPNHFDRRSTSGESSENWRYQRDFFPPQHHGGDPPHDREPPPDHGRPPPPDHGRPPPPDHHGGPPPYKRGPPVDQYDRPPLHDRGPPPDHYGRPPPRDRGPSPDHGGPPPNERGPPRDQYGRPPSHDRERPDHYGGPSPNHRGPPPGHYGRPPPYDRGPPPDHYGRHPPYNRQPPFDHYSRSPTSDFHSPRDREPPARDVGSSNRNDRPLTPLSSLKQETRSLTDSPGPMYEKLPLLPDSVTFNFKSPSQSPSSEEKNALSPRDNIDIRSVTEKTFDIGTRFQDTPRSDDDTLSQDTFKSHFPPLFQVIPVTPEG